jgi:hypothetical protein
LSDLQLGYALWAVLALAFAASLTAKRRDLPVLAASAGFLLLLVLPVPWITAALWNHIPDAVVRITYYWPMQRFYLIMAALVAAAGQIALESLPSRRGRTALVPAAFLLAGCCWSLWESRQFIRAAAERVATEASTAKLQRPENILLMDHAYGLFARIPAYFTNGVIDPRSQARLLSMDSGKPLPGAPGRVIRSGPLAGIVDANPGILDLSPVLHIASGRRYALDFAFARIDVPGILQVQGRFLSREYALPSSGEALAFGSGAGNSRSIDLWTGEPTGEDVSLRFIPMLVGATAKEFAAFGSFTLREIDPAAEPVRIDSLEPFAAEVRTESAALLETPRVFTPGYRATIDGHEAPVLSSDQGLASVPVPPGDHTVSLWFVGPALLRLSYWTSICTWSAILLLGALAAVQPRS